MKLAQAAGCLAALLPLAACAAGPGQGAAGPGQGPAGPGQGPAGPGQGPAGPGRGSGGSGHAPTGAGHGAAGPARGTITGRMVREGGPLGPGGQQPGTHPIPGTVRFTVGQHRVMTVQTTQAGTFSVQLPPGTYRVSDRSPRLLLVETDGKTRQTWSRPVTVIVTPNHVTQVTLASIVP